MSELEKILTPDQIERLQEVGVNGIKKHFEKLQQEKQAVCRCKDCEDERAAIQRQLDHPFYQKVDDFRDEIKAETMAKAAKKYREPFNPASWSIRQLGKHAMAENYDQGNYIVGLMEAAETLEAKVTELEKELAFAAAEADYWRQRLIKEFGPEYAEKKGGVIDERV